MRLTFQEYRVVWDAISQKELPNNLGFRRGVLSDTSRTHDDLADALDKQGGGMRRAWRLA